MEDLGNQRKTVSALRQLDSEEEAETRRANEIRNAMSQQKQTSQRSGPTGTGTVMRLLVLVALVPFSYAVGSGTNVWALIFTVVFFASSITLYFLPTIEASIRSQPNTTSIFLVNLLLGWSLLGWVVAFAWACKAPSKVVVVQQHINRTEPAVQHQPPPPTQQKAEALSVADEIKKLADLRSQGLISDEEFSKMKQKLMA